MSLPKKEMGIEAVDITVNPSIGYIMVCLCNDKDHAQRNPVPLKDLGEFLAPYLAPYPDHPLVGVTNIAVRLYIDKAGDIVPWQPEAEGDK